jgi:hypothetical protein
MNTTQVANAAHSAAARILAAGIVIESDHAGYAKAAMVGIPAAFQPLFIERFVGHVINVQCGTAGR